GPRRPAPVAESLMATDTLTEFVKALRGAGVPVSTAETLDALRVAEQLGYTDRGRLKAGLSLALAKTEQDKLRFAHCFDDFFAFARPQVPAPRAVPNAAEPPQGGSGEFGGGGSGGGMQGFTSELGQMLAQGDEAQLSARMAQAARAAGLWQIRVITQKGLFARRVMREMGADALDE